MVAKYIPEYIFHDAFGGVHLSVDLGLDLLIAILDH